MLRSDYVVSRSGNMRIAVRSKGGLRRGCASGSTDARGKYEKYNIKGHRKYGALVRNVSFDINIL